MTVAIVSTQRTWNEESEPWANYHLSLGFNKIYVFVDDGRTDHTPSSGAVQLIGCTREYWDAYPGRHMLHDLGDVRRDYGTPVFGSPPSLIQRQVLNANIGLLRAADDGIEWMLHIDDDEYFWCPDMPVGEHFDGMTRSGIIQAKYFNHEAALLAPDAPAEKRRRTYFKKSWFGLWEGQRNNLSRILGSKPYFSCYNNGKAAARVLPDYVIPDTAHGYSIADPKVAKVEFTKPAVLHRPYKSAAQFCDKYLTQGTFDTNTLYGQPWHIPEVHRRAQELVQQNDLNGLRALYEQVATLSEEERVMMEGAGFLLLPDRPLPFDEMDEVAMEGSPGGASGH